tara:strand:+ start:236 stop:412 length:177 start_codon:yes stop_codon:yes gene_type:complete
MPQSAMISKQKTPNVASSSSKISICNDPVENLSDHCESHQNEQFPNIHEDLSILTKPK